MQIMRFRVALDDSVPHLREINVNKRGIVTYIYARVCVPFYYRCRTHAALVDSYANTVLFGHDYKKKSRDPSRGITNDREITSARCVLRYARVAIQSR